MQRVNTATLHWKENTPVSDLFDDVYFNIAGGTDETQHVFIEGNQLNQRFKKTSSQQGFVIAETGFGTGLNFLVTRKSWLTHASPEARLHFISIEKFPLNLADIQQAWHAWPDLTDCLSELIAQYPPPLSGFHHLSFDQGRIQLTLIYGDLMEMLPQLDASVDAWFLDGFAPSKNPQMWQPILYQNMARLSHAETTFATFTVARQVRDGLSEVGFAWTKRPGFGRKREMLTGVYQAGQRRHINSPQSDLPILVIGAGLAGASTARALAEQGYEVCVLEAQKAAAMEGSGNPQGALYAKLAVQASPATSLHLHGLLYSVNQIKRLPDMNPPLASLCGVLQLATDEKEQQRQRQLSASALYPPSVVKAVDAEEASLILGATTPYSGLFFPQAGWVAPADMCRYLLDHPRITCHFDQTVVSIELEDDVWHTVSQSKHYYAQQVVVCTASDAKKIRQLQHLPIKPIRGQTSQVAATPLLPLLKTVVCGDGYISPSREQSYCFGATFDLHALGRECRDIDHQKNLQMLCKAVPEFSAITLDQCSGRTGYRCSTADYLPIVGQVAHVDDTLHAFASLRQDANSCHNKKIPRLKGLYINVGHGSKGLITCPISGELITAMISGSPMPLPNTLLKRLDPARFLLRDLARRRI